MSMVLCWLIGPALTLAVSDKPVEASGSEPVQVVYSIADLLAVDYDEAGRPVPFHADSDRKSSEEKLIRLITTRIAPESWASVGGTGVIGYFPLGMAIVVNQPAEVQQLVHRLLTSLREQIKQQLRDAIDAKLDSRVSLNIKDVPLRQAIDDLRLMSGLNMVADETALRQASVSLDQPLTLVVERVSLRSALNLLLKQAHLTQVVKDDAVVITVQVSSTSNLTCRDYHLADWMVPGHDSLVNFICCTICPDSWSAVGGPGTIRFRADARSLEVRGAPEINVNSEKRLRRIAPLTTTGKSRKRLGKGNC
ncbi:MAG: hypothetical protein FJ271_03630 [Planctomycetes bacterium]|nr:hypothetical protein [Planctomycetota bacterium]